AVPLTLAPLRVTTEGVEKEVTWKPVPVGVKTVVQKADPAEARDITPIEELPAPPAGRPRLLWAAALGVLAGVALGAFALLRRRAGRPVAVTPDRWALQELAWIAAQDLPAAGAVERYHTLLSNVVRRYLELRFQLRAPRQTTAEFL